MLSSQTIQNGQVFLQNRRTIIMGISPGNPFYCKVDNLRRLFHFATENSDKVLIFLPEILSEHNYRAIGSKKPARIARLNANSLRKKCKEAIQGTELQDTSLKYIDVTEEVENYEEYEKAFNTVKNLYEMNDKFRTDIRESTEAALRGLKKAREKFGGKRSENGDDEIMLDLEEGVKYLLKELAIFTVVPSIWKECSEQFLFVYHRPWPILENFFNGDYDGIPKPYFGFVVFSQD